MRVHIQESLKATINGVISRGVKYADITENGHLIFTLTDNSTVDLGVVVGEDGISPHIGANNHWFIGDFDTGINSRGDKGDKGDQGPAGESVTVDSELDEESTNAIQNKAVAAAVRHLSDEIDGKSDAIIPTANGCPIIINDSTDRKIRGLSVYGKSVQDGTPSPTNMVAIQYVPEGTSITLSDGDIQTQTVTTPCDLYEGDMWDVVTGVVLRKTQKLTVTGNENWVYDTTYGSDTIAMFDCNNIFENRYSNNYLSSKCTYFGPVNGLNKNAPEGFSTRGSSSMRILLLRYPRSIVSTVEELKAALKQYVSDGNPMIVTAELETPITEQYTPHPELRTYKPVTVVTNDDDAEMQLKYVADTKAYIDNKFNELTTAIVALGTV